MSRKHFIALADAIREHNRLAQSNQPYMTAFTPDQLDALTVWLKQQNSAFMRDRWIDYIHGECGPNGGAIRD